MQRRQGNLCGGCKYNTINLGCSESAPMNYGAANSIRGAAAAEKAKEHRLREENYNLQRENEDLTEQIRQRNGSISLLNEKLTTLRATPFTMQRVLESLDAIYAHFDILVQCTAGICGSWWDSGIGDESRQMILNYLHSCRNLDSRLDNLYLNLRNEVIGAVDTASSARERKVPPPPLTIDPVYRTQFSADTGPWLPAMPGQDDSFAESVKQARTRHTERRIEDLSVEMERRPLPSANTPVSPNPDMPSAPIKQPMGKVGGKAKAVLPKGGGPPTRATPDPSVSMKGILVYIHASSSFHNSKKAIVIVGRFEDEPAFGSKKNTERVTQSHALIDGEGKIQDRLVISDAPLESSTVSLDVWSSLTDVAPFGTASLKYTSYNFFEDEQEWKVMSKSGNHLGTLVVSVHPLPSNANTERKMDSAPEPKPKESSSPEEKEEKDDTNHSVPKSAAVGVAKKPGAPMPMKVKLPMPMQIKPPPVDAESNVHEDGSKGGQGGGAVSRYSVPKVTPPEPTPPEPTPPEPKAAEPKAAEPKAAEPKAAEPKAAEPKTAEPKTPPKTPEPNSAEPKAPEPNSAEPKAPEPKQEEKRAESSEAAAGSPAKKASPPASPLPTADGKAKAKFPWMEKKAALPPPKGPRDIKVMSTYGLQKATEPTGPEFTGAAEASSLTAQSPGPTPTGKVPKSPRVKSPGVKSPRVKSPGVKSAGVKSPGVKSPGVKSPGVKSPGVKSPGVKSPGGAKPKAKATSKKPHTSPVSPPASSFWGWLPTAGRNNSPKPKAHSKPKPKPPPPPPPPAEVPNTPAVFSGRPPPKKKVVKRPMH
eukprot:GHVO01009378.1.p1 GENE.GHVO01009378.1~~GHVO01009378.1.p1  ORF type:complete len:816 (+),score=134.08 GHVO01009378.1:893-3340(+)